MKHLLLIMILFGLVAFIGSPVAIEQTHDPSDLQIWDHENNSTDDGDSDDDGVDDEKEEAFARDIEYEAEIDRFKSKSTLRNGTTKDVFEVEFDVGSDNAAEIEFKFSNEVQLNSTTNNETELSYKVKFDEIVEFIDEGIAGYENETALSTYEIGKTGWHNLSVVYNDTIGLLIINATTLDGVFSLVMTLSSTFLNKNNVTIAPNSLKIDVYINGFSFTNTSSKLALKTHVKTESQLSIEQESEDELEGIASNETEVKIAAANATGFFSWAEFAVVGSSTIDVLSSTLENSTDEEGETSSKIMFTFDAINPQNIVWDPKMGVVSVASKQNLVAQPSDPTTSDTSLTSSDVSTMTSTQETAFQTSSENSPTTSSALAPIPLTLFILSLAFLAFRRFKK